MVEALFYITVILLVMLKALIIVGLFFNLIGLFVNFGHKKKEINISLLKAIGGIFFYLFVIAIILISIGP